MPVGLACDDQFFALALRVRSVGGMATLPEVRERLRQDLSDTGEERWPDDQLDRHIEHALAELSLAIPQELSETVATTPGSRDLATDGLAGLIEVVAIEFPVDDFPPCYASFASWGSVVTLHTSTPPDGADARIYYSATHILDEDGSTLPDTLLDVLLTGASAYAALELASGTTEKLNLDPDATAKYAAWARARLTAFQQLLHTYGRKNVVRPRRMYRPAG